MPQPASDDPDSEITTVFLLTDCDVLTQEQTTRLWRSVPTSPASEAPPTPTPAQLRNLKRMHPAYQGRLHRADPGPGTMEIYDPLTSSWSAVPSGAGRAQVGDTICCTLPDGRYLFGGAASASCATYDPGTKRWSTSPIPSARPGSGRRRGASASVIAVRMKQLT